MKPHRISLADIRSADRPAGYEAECLRLGAVTGDFVELSEEAYVALCIRFSPRGAGDIVARIAQPIAGVIDRLAGTDIKNCGGCAGRQEKLNRLIPFS